MTKHRNLTASPDRPLVELHFGLSLGVLEAGAHVYLHIDRERVAVMHAPPCPPPPHKALAAPALCLCIHMSTLFGRKLQTPSLNTSVCFSVRKGILLTTNHLKKINGNRRGRGLGLLAISTVSQFETLGFIEYYSGEASLWLLSPAGQRGKTDRCLGYRVQAGEAHKS